MQIWAGTKMLISVGERVKVFNLMWRHPPPQHPPPHGVVTGWLKAPHLCFYYFLILFLIFWSDCLKNIFYIESVGRFTLTISAISHGRRNPTISSIGRSKFEKRKSLLITYLLNKLEFSLKSYLSRSILTDFKRRWRL